MAKVTSAKVVAAPKKVAAKKPKRAPGPPRRTATAGPTMFPSPMVVAIAVKSALCAGIVCVSLFFFLENMLENKILSMYGSMRTWTKRVAQVMKMLLKRRIQKVMVRINSAI